MKFFTGNNYFQDSSRLFFLSLFVYFNLFWGSVWLGPLLLLLYLLLVSRWAQLMLAKSFSLEESWQTRVLSAFLVLASLGWLGGLFALLHSLNNFNIALVFFINGLVYLLIKHYVGAKPADKLKVNSSGQTGLDLKAKSGLLIYIGLVIVGFCLLYKSKTGDSLLSPWQTIEPLYLYVFLLATLLLGFLLFSKLKTKTILLLLILHSFLLHSYLPLTHKLVYGADQWRHLAIESQLLNQKPLQIQSFDSRQYLNPSNLAYSQFWATEVILARNLSLPLLTVNKWLLPLAWSLLLPLLLFQLAQIFIKKEKSALLFTWLGFLPFAWQAAGSFSLPVNWGFLVWLLMIVLLLKRLQKPNKKQLLVLGLLLAASIFGYSLYVVLFTIAWLAGEVLKAKSYKGINITLLSVAGMVTIPALEIITGFSRLNLNIDWGAQIKQFVGNVIAFYLASGPRPHDILGGNIIFNQTPNYAFVDNLLIQWRWWLVVFMLAVLVGLYYGAWQLFKRYQQTLFAWLLTMLIAVWGGYKLSWYFLEGERVLARRLDATLALLLLLVFFIGLNKFLEKKKKLFQPALILIFSLAMAASYSLGPDTKAVSKNEYQAMRQVWLMSKADKRCIVADTYPLLVLEYFSERQVVGGGLPINEFFAQPEREELFKKLISNPSAEAWARAIKLTGADSCWFVGPVAGLTDNQFFRDNSKDKEFFGNIVVWPY